jgi:hypothetical protein
MTSKNKPDFFGPVKFRMANDQGNGQSWGAVALIVIVVVGGLLYSNSNYQSGVQSGLDTLGSTQRVAAESQKTERVWEKIAKLMLPAD